MHNLTLIHTDLKPENILFVNSDYKTVPASSRSTKASRRLGSSSRSRSSSPSRNVVRVPHDSEIKVFC